MIDLTVLKNELTNDPLPLGYAPLLQKADDLAVANLLNAVQQTINIGVGLIPAYKIINATVAAEWATLTAQEKQRYQTITGAGDVDSSNPNIQAAFLAMFAAGTTTRANLIALATRKGSRAEQLFGAGTIISKDDIGSAR